jgi:WD40 repeat protein
MSRGVVCMPRPERPLGPGNDLVIGFARDLRGLRDQAGSPPYRELSARAHYSVGALSQAVDGRKLPSLPVTLAYVAACGGDTAGWEQRWKTVAAELSAEDDREVGVDRDARAPYAGLAVLEIDDADRFFGRERLVADLVKRLGRQRFLGVFGPSGCGKSSLLRAGLIAHLREDPATKAVPIVLFTPGAHPVEECAINLAGLVGVSPGELRDEILADPGQLRLRFRQVMVNRPAGCDLVLVVDQFEEIFTLCTDPAEREQFITALITATRPDSRARVVLGTRADFLGHCAQHADLVAALTDAQVLVGPMDTDELRLAITRPAEQWQCRVETALVARLVADTAGQPGALPLVSHALLQTWLRRRGTTLTLAGYEAAGGIEHALARTAEAIHASLDAHQQEVAKHLFLRLTALGDGTEDTKRRIPWDELDHDDPDTPGVLAKLTEARLLSLGHGSIDIAHEALIRHWPRLRDWLAEDRDGHEIHRQLTEATTSWEALNHDAGALYRGARLALAQAWAARTPAALTARERDFLAASRAEQDAARRAARRRISRRRKLVVSFSLLAVLSVISAVVAVLRTGEVDVQSRLALARAMVTKIPTVADDPQAAMLLAVEAFRLAPSTETRSALLSAQATSFAGRNTSTTTPPSDGLIRFDGQLAAPQSIIGYPRPATASNQAGDGVAETLSDAYRWALAPNGRTIAYQKINPQSGQPEQVVRIWDLQSRRETTTLAAGTVNALIFSSDSRMLAVAASVSSPTAQQKLPTNDLVLWDIASATSAILAHDIAGTVAFDPQGATIAFVNSPEEGDAVRLWNLASRQETGILRHPGSGLLDIAYSADGRTIAAATTSGTVLWDVASQQQLAVLPSATGVNRVAFTPDGKTLAASNTTMTSVWDLASKQQTHVLKGQPDKVMSLAFSPDGNRLAAAGPDLNAVGIDHSMVTWDVPGPTMTSSPVSAFSGVAHHPAGHVVATNDSGGTVRVWDTTTHREIATLTTKADPAWGAAFSPDGRTLAAVISDGAPRLWDTRTLTEVLPRHPTYQVPPPLDSVVTFSPDGRTIATSANGRTIYIWDTAPHGLIRTITVSTNGDKEIAHMVVAPDGRTIFGQTLTGEIISWNMTTGAKADRTHNSGTMGALAISPDGHTLATTGDLNTITLLDITTFREIGTLTGHSDGLTGLAFSPDGHTLASSDRDGTIKLWDTTTSQETATLTGHTDVVNDLTFSPDRHTLVSSSRDKTLRIWNTHVDTVMHDICGVLRGRVTAEQWQQLIPDLPFEPTCR